MELLWMIPFGLVLGGIAFSDAKRRIIPNKYVVALAVLSLVYSMAEKKNLPFATMLLALVFCMVFRTVAGDGIGMGDLKMLLALSCLFTVEFWLYSLLLSGILALVSKPVFHRKERAVPFGVYLAAGTFWTLWPYILQ